MLKFPVTALGALTAVAVSAAFLVGAEPNGHTESTPTSQMTVQQSTGAPPVARPATSPILEITGSAMAAEKVDVARAHAQLNTDSFSVTDESRVFQIGGPESSHFIVAPAFFRVIDAKVTMASDEPNLVAFGAEVDIARLKDAKTRLANGRALMSTTYWQIDTAGCLPYIYVNQVKMDACVRQEKLMNDGVPTQDYWAMHAWGTVYTVGGRKATNAWVQIQKSGTSAPFTMMDKQPGSSQSGSCQSVTLSVSAGSGFALSVSSTYSRCETWNPYYYGTPTNPYFKNTWSGDVRNGGSRQAAVSMSAYTAEWAYPVWYLTWGFTGCVIQQFWPDDCASTSGGG